MRNRINLLVKSNIFTLMMIVLVFAVALRLVNIASFSTQVSVAESTPPPKSFEKTNEEPPPLPDHQQKESADTHAAAPEKKDSSPVIDTAAEPPYGEHAFTPAEVEVLQSLAKRRDELEKRTQTLGQREALLKAAEGEVDRKITELNKIKGELEALLNKQKTAEDERVNSLVKIYENMKPKEAARIFDTLEMDVLLSVIGRMSERKSSPVLANMSPEKARQVTIQLAEQRKLPGVDKKPTPATAPAAPAAP